MRKLLSMMLVSMLTLTGCSSEVEGDDVLTVWYWDPALNGVAIQTAADLYKETNPDTEFEFVEMASEDVQTKFTTLALSGDKSAIPDIILLGDDIASMYLTLYPDMFSPILNETVDYNNFPDYKTIPMTVGDVTYGLPFDNSVSGLYCDGKIVSDAGLSEEDFQDITWSEFEQLGEQIYKETGKYAYTWSASTNLTNLIHSAGTDYINDDGSVYIAGNEALEAGLQVMQDMYLGGYVFDSVDWTDYINSISTSQAACTVSGAWFVPTVKQIEGGEGDWFIAPVPRLEGIDNATNATAEGGSSWYVLDSGDDELAADFLATTLGSNIDLYDQLLSEYGIVGTFLPASTSKSYSASDEYFGGQEIYTDFMKWAEDVPAYNVGENSTVGKDAINTYIIDVIRDNITVEEGISEAQAQADTTTGH